MEAVPNGVRKVLVANPRICTGCRSCEVFCSFHHYRENNPRRAFIRIVKVEDECLDIPVICHHCERPSCMAACPVGAIYRDSETGAVLIDHDKCIGCMACVGACPFGAIVVDPKTGDVVKCDLCGGDPVCVKVCPTRALLYVRADVAPRIFMEENLMGVVNSLVRERKPIFA